MTCCVRLHGTTTILALVAYSLKPVKLLGPCKRTQHCWPTTPDNVGSRWHLLRRFAWALKRKPRAVVKGSPLLIWLACQTGFIASIHPSKLKSTRHKNDTNTEKEGTQIQKQLWENSTLRRINTTTNQNLTREAPQTLLHNTTTKNTGGGGALQHN